MALPKGFQNPEDYFEECIQFFEEYQYLYNFPNTDILVRNVLDKINITNLEELDVNDENFDLKNIKDTFCADFFAKLEKLKPTFNDIEDKSNENLIKAPLSQKKKHEIINLTKEIKNICEEINCKVVVDLGSGLGYLDQLIYETTSFQVLGLECNETNYVGAKRRQRKYHENSLQDVKYIKHRITEDSNANIRGFLNDKFPSHTDFCMTGLHTCADLTIDAINIFLKMADAKILALLPCCYHKMNQDGEKFNNFPLSNCLKDIYERYRAFEFINVPFLRLASQPPNWSDKMEDLVFNLLARAVLQLYAWKHNCKLKRNKRKAVKTKSLENSFENYIQDASTHGFRLIKNETCDNSNKEDNLNINVTEILLMWRQITELTNKKVVFFILLQTYLQPVFENFVLYDRIVYMKEHGIKYCKFKRIFNENTSPRCLALLAYK